MITIVKDSSFFVKKKNILYAKKPDISGFFTTFYMSSFYKKPFLGFVRVPMYTKVIDLNGKDEKTLLKSFSKRTARYVNHAINEGVIFETEPSFGNFNKFYNQAVELKGLWKQNINQHLSDSFLITKAVHNGETLVMHLIFFDDEVGRAMIFQSASLFRLEEDSSRRNLIGSASRYLYYKDMLLFIEKGYKVFDLGGYAYETKNPELVTVNKFKDNFHGTLLCENGYYPIWKYLMDRLQGKPKNY